MVGRHLESRYNMYWLTRSYAFTARQALGLVPELEARLDAQARRLVERIHEQQDDEILLVAHSSGAIMAVCILARAVGLLKLQEQNGKAAHAKGVSGDVPTCLYTGFADTLQLSGNKFTGNLTDWVASSQSVYVSSISLSHNALTGTIPLSFQNYKWHKLDLSFNKLTGTLSRTLMEVPPNASDQVLYLENNRLSGEIPSSIRNLGNISILGTNVFSCRLDESDLPTNDDDRDKYHCGSDGFNVPYYVWLGTVCVFVGLAVAAAFRAKNHAVVVRCRSWYEAAYSQSGDSKHLRYVLDTFHRVCMVSVWC
eukprot:gene29916-33765_t